MRNFVGGTLRFEWESRLPINLWGRGFWRCWLISRGNFSDIFSCARCSDFPIALRGTVLKVFLEDTKARKLLICEDVSSMLSCMSSVSKASFSVSSGSSSSAAILSTRSLSLFLFRANCSKVFFSDTRHFLVHESGGFLKKFRQMSSEARSRSSVFW